MGFWQVKMLLSLFEQLQQSDYLISCCKGVSLNVAFWLCLETQCKIVQYLPRLCGSMNSSTKGEFFADSYEIKVNGKILSIFPRICEPIVLLATKLELIFSPLQNLNYMQA